MWDTTAANLEPSAPNWQFRSRFMESHISQKTSEIWGTRGAVVGEEFGPMLAPSRTVAYADQFEVRL